MASPAVAVEDLTKHYGEVRALDGVSLQTEPGEIFGLLGHNGAGKSTMIRILTGRAKPTSGRAQVLGHDVPRDLEAVRGEINLVAETPNVYQRATAKENLELFCTLYGLPKSRAADALEQVRLTNVGDLPDDARHERGRRALPARRVPGRGEDRRARHPAR